MPDASLIGATPHPEFIPPALDDEVEGILRDGSVEPWISPRKQELFLPLTGFAWFFQEEIEIINHPAFQRLGNVNQLGQAYYVYRGGTHKRIEHALGVVSMAQRIVSAIKKNAANAFRQTGAEAQAHLSECEERFVRLGALLHDIGHLAAGHTLEDELGLIDLHDGDARLSLIFDKINWPDAAFEEEGHSESLRTKIDRHFSGSVPEDLAAAGLTATDIVRLLVRKKPSTGDDAFGAKEAALKKSSNLRYNVCSKIIGDTICADLLDYLYRDWYHVGRARSLNDRIFQYMEIRAPGATHKDWHERRSANDHFVISLGTSPSIRTDGVSAILGLLEARYELAEAVLFHRTKLAAGAMLDRALFELFEGESSEFIVEKFLNLSDEELLDVCLAEARSKQHRKKEAARSEVAGRILGRLKGRRLYSGLFTAGYNDFPDGDRAEILKLFSGDGSENSKGIAARNRAQTARFIEDDFDLIPGSIALYCVRIKPKIAKVRIAVDGRMGPFDELESDPQYKDWLAGGHLAAQINRFNRLQKLHFFISREEAVRVGEEHVAELRAFIKSIVIRRGDDLWQGVRDKASSRYMSEHYQSNTVSYDREGGADSRRYPNGAPKLKNFLRSLPATATD